MSYTAPKFYGYGPSSGGYSQFLNGYSGKKWNKKSHKAFDNTHKLQAPEAPQNRPDEASQIVEARSGGTQMGVILNELTIDKKRAPVMMTDMMGPSTDAVAMGNNTSNVSMTIKKPTSNY